MLRFILFLHIIGATIWVGGHLVLTLRVLPTALKTGDATKVDEFEGIYEGIGIPALVVQVLTGLWLAHRVVPSYGDWFSFSNSMTTLVSLKLILLAMTAGLAVHARFWLIPKLDSGSLRPLATHIIGVTTMSVLFVYVGVGFRYGGL